MHCIRGNIKFCKKNSKKSINKTYYSSIRYKPGGSTEENHVATSLCNVSIKNETKTIPMK